MYERIARSTAAPTQQDPDADAGAMVNGQVNGVVVVKQE